MSTAVPNNGSHSASVDASTVRSTTTGSSTVATATTTPARGESGDGTPFTEISSGRKTTNSIMGLLMWACMIIALIPLMWLLFTVISRGAGAVFSVDWWTQDMLGVRNSAEGGGALAQLGAPGAERPGLGVDDEELLLDADGAGGALRGGGCGNDDVAGGDGVARRRRVLHPASLPEASRP